MSDDEDKIPALDAFKHLTGDATFQLTNALMDWRDQKGKR